MNNLIRWVFLFISILLLSVTSCKKDSSVFLPSLVPPPTATTTQNIPAMTFGYSGFSFEFLQNQVTCQSSSETDTTGRYFTLTADNGLDSMVIRIVTDSIRAQAYILDGKNGNIDVFLLEPTLRIGEQGPAKYNIQIQAVKSGKISGTLSGELYDSAVGYSSVPSTGSFTGISIL